jgi:hypothetical protein
MKTGGRASIAQQSPGAPCAIAPRRLDDGGRGAFRSGRDASIPCSESPQNRPPSLGFPSKQTAIAAQPCTTRTADFRVIDDLNASKARKSPKSPVLTPEPKQHAGCPGSNVLIRPQIRPPSESARPKRTKSCGYQAPKGRQIIARGVSPVVYTHLFRGIVWFWHWICALARSVFC